MCRESDLGFRVFDVFFLQLPTPYLSFLCDAYMPGYIISSPPQPNTTDIDLMIRKGGRYRETETVGERVFEAKSSPSVQMLTFCLSLCIYIYIYMYAYMYPGYIFVCICIDICMHVSGLCAYMYVCR